MVDIVQYKQPMNQFEPVQLSRQLALRAYCTKMYILWLISKNNRLKLTFGAEHCLKTLCLAKKEYNVLCTQPSKGHTFSHFLLWKSNFFQWCIDLEWEWGKRAAPFMLKFVSVELKSSCKFFEFQFCFSIYWRLHQS